MKQQELEYLCRTIGNLAGIPIRVYRGRTLSYFYCTTDFPEDPVKPYLEEIFAITERIGYFVTPYFNYYGVVRSRDAAVVLGPSRQTPMSDKDLRELAFACDLDSRRTEDFLRAMKSLVHMPLGSIVQILCALNYVLCGECLSLEDVTIYDVEQTQLSALLERERLEEVYERPDATHEVHNTLAHEERLLGMIEKGDVGALCEWLSQAPSMRGGVIANDALRQLKNTFIVTATLTSRAAIRGGMASEDALSLSDDYIRKCEMLTGVEAIVNLQYHMVIDYTRRVERIRLGRTPSKLLIEVTQYVQHNLSRPLDVAALAKSLYVSRTHLACRFKEETGMTLTDFILREKIEEAKRLLAHTDKPLSQIADYLGFSSQSHFTKSFKKYSGKTPGAYRLQKS